MGKLILSLARLQCALRTDEGKRKGSTPNTDGCRLKNSQHTIVLTSMKDEKMCWQLGGCRIPNGKHLLKCGGVYRGVGRSCRSSPSAIVFSPKWVKAIKNPYEQIIFLDTFQEL